MSLFNDMVSNIKKVVMTDDEGFLNEENGYVEEEEKKGFFGGLKKNSEKKSDFPSFSTQGYNLNGFDYGKAKQNQNIRKQNQGRIQVYVPKNFDESFDIIKGIENGITAMVNVETTSQQNAMRIIDCISGAMFALNGQCKKIGEKQYIFTLNAELTGAIDYLPGQGNPYSYREQYQSFDMQNPFSFGNANNNQNQGFGYQNNMPSQNGYNNPPQYQNQNYPQNFDYVKPQNQF
ncbi:MAG: cell division protein SepF [Lachnospiraceae bacterium]|nr:cell division protein SepF [Lachnospiraceae bacterium]